MAGNYFLASTKVGVYGGIYAKNQFFKKPKQKTTGYMYKNWRKVTFILNFQNTNENKHVTSVKTLWNFNVAIRYSVS